MLAHSRRESGLVYFGFGGRESRHLSEVSPEVGDEELTRIWKEFNENLGRWWKPFVYTTALISGIPSMNL